MLSLVFAGLAAFSPGSTVSIPAPHGRGSLTVLPPAGFRPVGPEKSRVLLLNGKTQILVTWSAGVNSPTLLRAMDKEMSVLRKQGNVLGPVAIGAFRGILVRMPIKNGLAYHAAMLRGRDRISVSYYDPAAKPAAAPPTVELVRRFISTARLAGA